MFIVYIYLYIVSTVISTFQEMERGLEKSTKNNENGF